MKLIICNCALPVKMNLYIINYECLLYPCSKDIISSLIMIPEASNKSISVFHYLCSFLRYVECNEYNLFYIFANCIMIYFDVITLGLILLIYLIQKNTIMMI